MSDSFGALISVHLIQAMSFGVEVVRKQNCDRNVKGETRSFCYLQTQKMIRVKLILLELKLVEFGTKMFSYEDRNTAFKGN
jgi:hypothetical protein